MATVLFIEDEPALQKALTSALEREGFSVLSALDGQTGLEKARKHKPDAILLDLILPRMDGFDVLKTLKSDASTRSIPAIILTNLEDVGDAAKAIELGAAGYLVKTNYKLDELVEKTRTLISRNAK